jgi:competence protein ComEA
VRELLADHGRAPQTGDEEPELRPPTSRWQHLLARAPLRVDPGRSGAVAVGLAVLVAALVTGWWLLSQRPHEVPIPASAGVRALSDAPTPVGTGEQPATPSPSLRIVVVDVAGRVHRPGLYRLPDGARVNDALRAAGGPLHGVDLSSLNLAAKVIDGQQILVGAAQAGTPPAAAAGTASSQPGTVSLNSAGLEQLETLPGVGPVLAQKIIDWRTANGGFTSIDQLTDVSGIGDVTFAELEPLVTL